jgi:hypothetical protein
MKEHECRGFFIVSLCICWCTHNLESMLISSVSYSLEWPFFNYVWNGLNYQQVCNFYWLHYNTSQVSQFALRFVHNGVLGTVSEYHPLYRLRVSAV